MSTEDGEWDYGERRWLWADAVPDLDTRLLQRYPGQFCWVLARSSVGSIGAIHILRESFPAVGRYNVRDAGRVSVMPHSVLTLHDSAHRNGSKARFSMQFRIGVLVPCNLVG